MPWRYRNYLWILGHNGIILNDVSTIKNVSKIAGKRGNSLNCTIKILKFGALKTINELKMEQFDITMQLCAEKMLLLV